MKTVAGRSISESTRASLAKCELFEELNDWQLTQLAELVLEQSFKPDEMLLREGEDATVMYVVVEGRGVAQLEMYNGWLSLGLIGPSDAAGWTSLEAGQVYAASVKALTPMRVARIDSGHLMLLMDLVPAIGYSVSKRLASVFCRQYRAALEAFKASG